MHRVPHAILHSQALLLAGLALSACLRDPIPLPAFDGSPPATSDASIVDAGTADASSADATPNDAPGIDALNDASFDAIPSPNTHSVRFTPADDSYLAAADQSLGLDIVNAMTFEAWVKLASLPGSGQRYTIVVKSDVAAVQDSYSFEIQNEPGAGYRMIAGVYGTVSSSPDRDAVGWDWPTLATGTWYHLAVTYDLAQADVLSKFHFYLNGSEVGGGLLLLDGNIDAIRDSTAPMVIGARVTGGASSALFDGQIDDVRIWNVVRGAGDIAGNRAVELSGTEPGLLGYWQLDSDLLDAAANANDLSVTGSPPPSFVADAPF